MPAASRIVGSRSRYDTIRVVSVPAANRVGHRTIRGTRRDGS
jgi:hypothetical protein